MVQVVVHQDYDGYFESRVRGLLAEKANPKHSVVHVNALPWLPDGCQYESKDGVLHLTFYAALRAGFGNLDWNDVKGIL